MYYIKYFIYISLVLSQSEHITSIKVEGNKHTQEYIILREIQQQVNQELNEANLVEDKNRIYNLGLFSNVEIEVTDNVYLVTVSEMWYIWPFPIIKYDNKSEEFSYGGGIMHNNLRGQDTDIVFGATLGNVREYFVWYQNPWISGDHNSFETGIYNESSDHFFYNIIEKDKGFFVKGGFYRGYSNQFDFWMNYNNKIIDTEEDSNKSILESNYLEQSDFSYIRLGSEYTHDTRDVHIDPHSGMFFNVELINSFGLGETQNILEVSTYFSKYINLYPSYFSPVFRYSVFSKYQYSESALPIYSKEYIGGQGYVRGYSALPSENLISNSKNLIEVDNFIINTFEIQSTLIKRKEYLEKVEMGVDFILFADWGVGCNLDESINFDNSLLGYGIGLRIFIMGGLIKIDYGFNPRGASQLHLF